MTSASWLSIIAFALTLCFVGLTILRKLHQTQALSPSLLRNTFLGLMCWLALTGALAYNGVLSKFFMLPPPLGLLVLTSFLLTTTLALSSFGNQLLTHIGLPFFLGLQVFRIPVEWCLHQLYLEGILPIQMTYSGRNLDILAGLTALPIAWALTRKKLPRWTLFLWNVLCLGLLLNIVTTATLSMPGPFRVFTNEPANRELALFPFIWLPTFLVQVAFFTHLLTFRFLWRSRNSSETTSHTVTTSPKRPNHRT